MTVGGAGFAVGSGLHPVLGYRLTVVGMDPTTHLDENPTWAPTDACTLPTAERPLRMAEFDALFATSLRSVDRTDDTRARLLLAGDATLTDRTQRLADAEASCCSFFTFGVTDVGTGEVAFD